MGKRISLPVLVWIWIRNLVRQIENSLFKAILKRHNIESEGHMVYPYTYWMNIVRCVGGREKMKPCEYIFDNPWHARMHEEICRTCLSWEYVTTIKVLSKKELTTTNYQKLVDEDEEFKQIIAEMQRTSPGKQEYEEDQVEFVKSSRR